MNYRDSLEKCKLFFRKKKQLTIERPPGVREVMSSIPVGESDFFLCPNMLVPCRLTHLSPLLPRTKFTIFIHL